MNTEIKREVKTMKHYEVSVYYGEAKMIDYYRVNAEDEASARFETVQRIASETDFNVFHPDFAILYVGEVR